MTYLDYKKKIEFGLKEFKEIDSYCKKRKITWFASAWDIESQNFLKRFKLKFNKVASVCLQIPSSFIKLQKKREQQLSQQAWLK